MTKIQGFNNFAVDISQSILWQYDNAANLLSLISAKQSWYYLFQTSFWGNWYEDVFNLSSVDTFGAAIWSIILDVPLLVAEPINLEQPVWGFNKYNTVFPTLLNTYLNYENGNFLPYNPDLVLTLQQQRWMLRLRYFQLSTLTNIAGINTVNNYSINTFLNYLCVDNDIGYTGTIYVVDNLDMTVTYTFTGFNFPENLVHVLLALDIFPRPAGVALELAFP